MYDNSKYDFFFISDQNDSYKLAHLGKKHNPKRLDNMDSFN